MLAVVEVVNYRYNCESGIYKIECTKTLKCYIGQTTNFNRRYLQHFRALARNKHSNRKLQGAFNKYGEDNFKFIIIEIISQNTPDLKEYITSREQYWMDYYKAYNCGYNLSPSAGNSTLGFKFSVASKNKIKIKAQNRIIKYETRLKISESLKNREFTEEHRKKLSIASKLRYNSDENRYLLKERMDKKVREEGISLSEYNSIHNGFKGKHHTKKTKDNLSYKLKEYFSKHPCSEEIKQKRSKNATGENNPMYGKRRIGLNKGGNNGSAKKVLYRDIIYPCIKEFKLKLNLKDSEYTRLLKNGDIVVFK